MDSLTLINEQFLGAWGIYNTFYTAFLTVNLAALAVVAQKVSHRRARLLICIAFVVQNILSGVTAYCMSGYSAAVGASFAADASVSVLTASANLGWWGGIANATSHALFVGLWIAAYFYHRAIQEEPAAAAR